MLSLCIFTIRERQQLQQDVAVKQEQVMKGKEEVSSLQEDLQEANRQREQLEKQKQEVQGQLEEIDNQVSGGGLVTPLTTPTCATWRMYNVLHV